jgi:hypothetical protein
VLVAFNASAADVTVAWDANSESDLAGYKFFYGTSIGNYTFSKDVGNTTSYTVTNLEEGETYYFAARAYDTSDNESDYSKELVYTHPDRSVKRLCAKELQLRYFRYGPGRRSADLSL